MLLPKSYSQMSMKRLVLIFSISMGCIIADQTIKLIAIRHLSNMHAISVLGGILRLRYVQNDGAFLGLGSSLPVTLRFWLLTVMVGVILLLMLLYTLFNNLASIGTRVGFSLIIGGGTGNLIDRLAHEGSVVDFMNIGIGNVRTGIFNLADAFILAGAVIVIFIHLRPEKLPGRKKDKSD